MLTVSVEDVQVPGAQDFVPTLRSDERTQIRHEPMCRGVRVDPASFLP
jgi:hypothetical protein